jgi:hypothetical protein
MRKRISVFVTTLVALWAASSLPVHPPVLGFVPLFGQSVSGYNGRSYSTSFPNGRNYSTGGPGQSYATGTAFQEVFGNQTNGGAQACWSGGTGSAAQCNQLWVVSAGSGQTITTAPSGYGFTSTNVLELPSGSTALSMDTYGTMPTVPPNTGFTVTAVMGVSAFDSSSVALVEFIDGSGHMEAWFGERSTGYYFNNQDQCAASAASAVTLKIVSNGSTMSFYINGTQCGSSISDPGYMIREVLVAGGTDFNLYVQSIIVNGTTVTGSWPPSSFSDWASQSGTVTASGLAAGTHSGNQSSTASSAWGQASTTGVSFSFVSTTTPSIPSWTVGGASYSGNTGVAYQMSVTTTAGSAGFWSESFLGSVYSNVSITLDFEFSANFDDCDFAGLGGGSHGIINNLQLKNFSGSEELIAESDNTGTSSTIAVPLSTNTWYRVTWQIGPTGTDNIDLYSISGTSQTLLGSATFPTDYTYSGSGVIYFQLGKTGDETQSESGTIDYANVGIAYANAPFPLVP